MGNDIKDKEKEKKKEKKKDKKDKKESKTKEKQVLNENKNQNQKKVEKKQQKQQKQQKVDKKLVRKLNKDCLGQNKQIEINNDTEKLILFGLSQKENILKRDENNYEKIANLLIKVIFNEKNIKQKNKQK